MNLQLQNLLNGLKEQLLYLHDMNIVLDCLLKEIYYYNTFFTYWIIIVNYMPVNPQM